MHRIIVGLDVASTSARAFALDLRTGTVLLEKNLPATTAGEDELLAILPSASAIVMESTGRYHLTWARRFTAAGHQAYVLNALLAKRLSSTHTALRQRKTDTIDARHLAEIGQVHLPKLERFLFTPEHPTRVRLRALCIARRSIRSALTNALRTAHHLLSVMLPDADRIGLNLAYNQGLTALFLRIDSLGRLQRMRTSTLAEYACSKADALASVLATERIPAAVFDAMLPALQAQLRTVQALREQMVIVDAELRTALRANAEEARTAALVTSIPGYGPRTAAVVIACLPPEWRSWGSKRQIANRLQAYWGFDPRPRESGKWKGQVRMTKRGIEMARTALFQCSTCALLHDRGLKSFYEKKRASGQHHLVTISHVMRKQLHRLVAVLVDEHPFVSAPESVQLPS